MRGFFAGGGLLGQKAVQDEVQDHSYQYHLGSVEVTAGGVGVKVVERLISIQEVISTADKGTLKEAFASGTAAIVSPVGQLYFRGKEHSINDGKTGPLAQKLYNEILQIQYGLKDDPFGWRVKILDGEKS